jgi:hypothetical protein
MNLSDLVQSFTPILRKSLLSTHRLHSEIEVKWHSDRHDTTLSAHPALRISTLWIREIRIASELRFVYQLDVLQVGLLVQVFAVLTSVLRRAIGRKSSAVRHGVLTAALLSEV